jgi:hypothetical protein
MEAMDVSFSFCVLVDENGLFASVSSLDTDAGQTQIG